MPGWRDFSGASPWICVPFHSLRSLPKIEHHATFRSTFALSAVGQLITDTEGLCAADIAIYCASDVVGGPAHSVDLVGALTRDTYGS